MRSIVNLLTRTKSAERKGLPGDKDYFGAEKRRPDESEASLRPSACRLSETSIQQEQLVEVEEPVALLDFKRDRTKPAGKLSDDSAYVGSDQRGNSSNSTRRSEMTSTSSTPSEGAEAPAGGRSLPSAYRASFDTAKARSSIGHSAAGSGVSSGLESAQGSSDSLETSGGAAQRPGAGQAAGPSGESSPSMADSYPSRASQDKRFSHESGPSETSSGRSRRSSFALERASFESNRASLDKFRKTESQAGAPLPEGVVKDPLSLCEALCIPQNMWQRFLALAVVPVDTPLPMSMLRRLWSLKSNADSEATANLLAQLGVMKVACLADSTAWALVQPSHLKALQDVAAKEMWQTHTHLLEEYAGGGADGLADIPDDGYIMQNVGHHLVHIQRLQELRQLLLRPAWLECKLHSYGVASVVADFRRYLMVAPDDGVKLLLEAFQMSVSGCLTHPTVPMLHAQLAGRLMLVRKSAQVQLDPRRLASMQQAGRGSAVCLRTRTPSLEQAGGLQRMTLRGHTGGVKKVLLTPGGVDIITSSTDGTSRVWDMEIGDCVLLLEGHSGPLADMATAADGSIVVTASEDGTARVWDLEEGTCVSVLVGHSGAVNSVAVDRFGKIAVTAGADGTGRVWNVATGTCIQLLLGHTSLGALHKIILTRDGSRAITCSSDFTARAWEVFSGNCVHVFSGHTAWVVDAALTSDSSLLVTASHDGTARAWDMLSGRCVHVLQGHAGRINAVRVAQDDRTVVTVSDDFTAKVFDLQSGSCRHTLEGHGGWVSDCAVMTNNEAAITASGDDLAVVWDILHGSCTNVLEGHSGEVLSVVLTRRGRFAVSGSMDGTARIWDLAAGSAHLQRAHSGRVHGLVATPDGTTVISYGDDGCLVWNVEESACTASLEGPAVRWAACLEDGQHVLCASGDRTTSLWDLKTFRSTVALPGTRGSRVKSCAASRDGRIAVVVLFDSTVTVWDLERQEPLTVLQRWGQRDGALGHTGGVNAAYVSQDGCKVLTVSKDCTARIWDVSLGTSTHVLEGHSDGVTGAAISDDSRLAATLAYDSTARLWDMESGACLGVMPHGAAVNRAVFSVDGSLLLTASSDHLVLLWKIERSHKPHPVHVFKGHKEELMGIALSRDNRWAATCSRDNSLKLWNCVTGQADAFFASDAGLTCCLFAGSTLIAGDDSGILHLLELPLGLGGS